MNTVRIFQIFDKTANAISGPIMAFKRKEVAIRAFNDICAMESSMMSGHQDEFTLLYLGDLNEDTGVITPITPETVHTGAAWKESHTTSPS